LGIKKSAAQIDLRNNPFIEVSDSVKPKTWKYLNEAIYLI
jgi:hypothetical protein